MRADSIGVNVHYLPIYKFTYFKSLFKVNESAYPNTEEVYSRILTLPIHCAMDGEDVASVISSLKKSMGVKK